MNFLARLLVLSVASALGLLLPRSALAGGAACETMIPCQSDSDCGSGTRCISGIGTECIMAPDGGQSCGPSRLCWIPWQVECLKDSDCGDGFTCTMTGRECNCSGSDAGVPASAVSTPCSAAMTQIPNPCPTDAGCPPPICDGGACLCWQTGTCFKNATSACTSASQCPSGWSCTSGTCEPTCWGDGTFAGPSGSSSGGSAGAANGDPGSDCSTTSPGGSPDAVPWLVVAVGVAVIAGKRRRRGSCHPFG